MRMKEKQKNLPVSAETLDQLISQVKDPTSLSSVEDLCKSLKKSLIERLLETEMTHHLGYAKHSKREEGGLNYIAMAIRRRLFWQARMKSTSRHHETEDRPSSL